MPTVADLRRRIERLRKRIAQDQAEVALWEETIRRMDALGADRAGLRQGKQGGNVNNMNAAAHALATSGGKSNDALVQMANRHGYTLRRLAKEAGVSVALLSRARRGDRSLKRPVAQKIEDLIGFKATSGNWPGGLT